MLPVGTAINLWGVEDEPESTYIRAVSRDRNNSLDGICTRCDRIGTALQILRVWHNPKDEQSLRRNTLRPGLKSHHVAIQGDAKSAGQTRTI